MNKVAVIGCGLVGHAIALDLSNSYEVLAIDRNKENGKHFIQNTNIEFKQGDVFDSNFSDFLQGIEFVVLAIPGFVGFNGLKRLIELKKNVADISFFPEDARQLNELAVKNNVKVIVDIGLAPGIGNLILGHLSNIHKINSYKCMVGGLPQDRSGVFEYKAPFSPIDVIEEYTRPARIKINNQLKVVEPLTEIETIKSAKYGTFEAFNTDGLRSLLFSFPEIPNLLEKTVRYPQHAEKILFLKKAGFFKEEFIENTSKVLLNEWKSSKDEKEFSIMWIEIKTAKNQTFKYFLYDIYDEENNVSSMARTTGYTCCAALNELVHGSISKPGVYPPELAAKQFNVWPTIENYLLERKVKLSSSFE